MNIQKLNEILRVFEIIRQDFSSNTKKKNLFLCTCIVLDPDINLKEVDPKFPFGGLIGYGNSCMDYFSTSQSFWCTQHLHGINWSSGYKKYTELEKILKNLEATDTEFFAKGYEKCKILSEFLETKIINLDDYACPKVQFLIFKDEEYDWSSNKILLTSWNRDKVSGR